jgi:hypothetical protein
MPAKNIVFTKKTIVFAKGDHSRRDRGCDVAAFFPPRSSPIPRENASP